MNLEVKTEFERKWKQYGSIELILYFVYIELL